MYPDCIVIISGGLIGHHSLSVMALSLFSLGILEL
jgi:hypothetical protein